MPLSLPLQSYGQDLASTVMLPTADGFLEWQEAPELAEVINARFDLPRPIVAGILALIRATKASREVAKSHK